MTRSEYETICRVLKDAKHANVKLTDIGEASGGEGMRRRLAYNLADAFELTDIPRSIFLQRAGVTVPVTR
jgi:hypothetical protein